MKKEQQGQAGVGPVVNQVPGGRSERDDLLPVHAQGQGSPISMSPSQILKLYYLASFLIGLVLAIFLAHWISTKEIGIRGAAIITVSLNVLLIMILPLVLDWAECRYFKARFLGLEEIAKTNPDLASSLEEQCKRLAIPKLRLAIIESSSDVLFSYGLWRLNPRLVLSASMLSKEVQIRTLPSIEAELARFAGQDKTLVFLMFTVVQMIFQVVLLSSHLVP